MARPLRCEHPGAVYHVTSRGNARAPLFLDDVDRAGFFRALARVVEQCGWLCHAYCLMENHYHLVVETPKPNLSVGMGRLNSTHAQGFNARHSRVGHVFQGRYHAVLVEKEAHLLEVCRYVVLNPVRAGLCATPSGWQPSSFLATAGLAQRPSFLTTQWVLAQFGGTRRRAQERYRAFVAEGLDDWPWQSVRGQIYLGSEEFALGLSAPNDPIAEVPRAQWKPARRPLDEVFRDHGSEALAVAYRTEGYYLREIAEHLGVHLSTVSRHLRKLEA